LCGLFWAAWGGKETDADRMVSVKEQKERNSGRKWERTKKKEGKKE
jgi:hypothetical protein